MVLKIKMIIYSVKNWKNHACYKFKKSDDYFKFLFGLLKIRNAKIPDIYNADGKEESIFERVNTCIVYESDEGDIIEITSKEFVFLIILNIDESIRKYIQKNSKFYTPNYLN